MSETISELPPLVGKQRRRFLAKIFGSPDGRVGTIADESDRARCQARLDYEAAQSQLWNEELFRDRGSPSGLFEDVPADRQENAAMAAHYAIGEVERFARINAPRIAAMSLDPRDLTDPFGDDDRNGYFAFPHRLPSEGYVKPMTGLVPMEARLPDSRLKFIALYFGADSGALNDVSEDLRDDCRTHVLDQDRDMLKWLSDVCKLYGSNSGKVVGIPAGNARDHAARHWHRAMRAHENRAAFELALLRIELREKAQHVADEMEFG